MDTNLVSDVCLAILDYLKAHPQACDTAEGIHNWWIKWPGLPESLVLTQHALSLLESEGQLQRRKIGTSELWSIAKRA
ncbi:MULTISPECIES: hypothetical protein [Undibacterium]|jgi:hypothetical protein|uniref:hypothetical protein n=1 Tax=Undibacterium TaxID=401469 RepID=UPI00138A6C51|nr:hypothetical protein [Undibacterium crateris]NDI85384.1 hypothetical protein [Undibacterium crateris]